MVCSKLMEDIGGLGSLHESEPWNFLELELSV